MKRRIQVIGGIFAAICLAVYLLLYTSAGLVLTLAFVPNELSVGDHSGSIAGGFTLQEIEYRSAGHIIQAAELAVDWRPWRLAGLRVDIREMNIRDISIVLAGEAGPDSAPQVSFSLSLDFSVEAFTAENIVVSNTRSGTENRIRYIRARAYSAQQTVFVEELVVTHSDYRISTDGRISFVPAPAYDLSVFWDWRLDESLQVRGVTGISGDLDRTLINTALHAPFAAEISFVMDDILHDLSWQGSASTADLNPATFSTIADTQLLALTLSAQGTVNNASMHGTIRLASDTGSGTGYRFEELDAELDLNVTVPHGESPEISLGILWHKLRLSRDIDEVFLSADDGNLDILYAEGGYRLRSVSGFNFNNQSAGSWRIAGSGDLSYTKLGEIHLDTEHGGLQGSLLADWSGDKVSFQGAAVWDKLDLPYRSGRNVRLSKGDLAVSGTVDHYTLELRTLAQTGEFPDIGLELQSAGDTNELRLDSISLQLLDGKISGKGRVNWIDGLRSSVTLSGQGLDPGQYHEAWPGRLALELDAAVEIHEEETRIRIDEFNLSGILRGFPLDANFAATFDNGRVNIRQAGVRSYSSILEIASVPGELQTYDWRIHAPDLNTLHPELLGHIDGEGQISGTVEQPQLAATLRAEGIRSPWLQLDQLDMQTGINLTDAEEVDIIFDIAGLRYEEYLVDTIAVAVTGRLGDHRYTLTSAGSAFDIGLTGQGVFHDGVWSGRTESLRLEHNELGRWIASTPPVFSIEKGRIQLDEVCLSQEQAQICGNGSWIDSTDWRGNLTAQLIPLQFSEYFLPEHIALGGTASLQLRAEHSADTPMSAEALLQLSRGEINFFIDENTQQQIRFDGVDAILMLADGVLESNLTVKLDENGSAPATARATITGLEYLPVGLSDLHIDGAVKWSLQDLSFLSVLSPFVADTEGKLEVNLAVNGRLPNPDVSGDIALFGTAFIVPDLGIALTDISARGHAGGDGTYEVIATAASSTGAVSMTASYNTQPAGADTIHATVSGDNFEIVNLPEIRALASTDLQVRLLADRRIVTKGTVVVADAVIDLDRMRSQVTLSDDVVFTERGVPVEETVANRFEADLQISLADNIRVQGQGISGRLTGDMRIRSTPKKEMIGTGEISIVSGTFSAYGQSLTIDEGRLIYRGDRLDNPEIRVTASRRTGSVSAGVRVSGLLTNPVITLYSSPSMNQEEILSYIVFGRPLASLTSGEGMDLVGAATAIGLQNSGFITKSLSSTFGLDDLHIDADAGAETMSLVVGKYLTPKLYLSYGIGLLDTINTARIRYDLTKSWSLEATSGEDVGVDIFYRIDR